MFRYYTTTYIYELIKDICYYKTGYDPYYWRDACKVGSKKAEIINCEDLSLVRISSLLEDLTSGECYGIYMYFLTNRNEKWELILAINPFKEDLISIAYMCYYSAKEELLKGDIEDYPNQVNLMIDWLESYESTFDDRVRIDAIDYLKGL